MSSEMPEIGKVSREIFDEIILPRIGQRRADVLVGPQHGVDVGIVDLGHGQVMATTTDPIFIVPAYGWERAAWFAVHILVSDAVTSGLAPTYITLDLNLPLSMDRKAFEAVWTVIHRECDRLGMAVISGHTGRYQGCDYPMVGGATVMCIGSRDKYVTPQMAQVGDAVILTKGAAIEAAGLFAVSFPERVARRYGPAIAKESESIFWQMSVVEDALTAVSVGVREKGVTAMHDATECGVWGGLFEVAEASGVGMAIEKGEIILQPNVARICDLFDIDPYTSISEGTLIITCRPDQAAEVVRRLGDKGIRSSVVGEVVPKENGVCYSEGGRSVRLSHPRVDPFWAAFGRAMAEGSAAGQEPRP